MNREIKITDDFELTISEALKDPVELVIQAQKEIKISIKVGPQAEVKFLETNSSAHQVTISLQCADGAHVEYYQLANATHTFSQSSKLTLDQKKSSTVKLYVIECGGKITTRDIQANLNEEGAECSLYGLAFGRGDEQFDTSVLINHQAPHGKSDQVYKTILNDKSRAKYAGMVEVQEGAVKTDAHQSIKNLLLSDEAQASPIPGLKILADDVKCSHGATVGQLDEDQLFYLQSRGVNATEARQLLTYAFAQEILDAIKPVSIKKQVQDVFHVLMPGSQMLEGAL